MRVTPLLLLAACSPSVVVVPSSLPAVQIDRSLAGPVCSREAAEVIAALRTRERSELERRLIDCQGEKQSALSEAQQQTKRAEANAWWGSWGGVVAAAVGVVAFGAGLAIGWGR